MTPKIVAEHVSKAYPTADGTVLALQDFSLSVQPGEFVCIVGPSGCGKSTFLRIVAGLTDPTDGTVSIAPGADASKPLNNVVFQEYAIFPWKTVQDNVAFGLQMRGYSKAQRHEVADMWLTKVGLRKFRHAYPHQLSGGMKQRVSIARALANDPEVLLMDEPLGALDAQTRTVLQEELLRLWEETHKTVLYITHSIDEAVLLGDRVVVMTARPGQHKQTFPVDLPRPRTLETTTTPPFRELAYSIWESLQDEVRRAMAAEAEPDTGATATV